MLASRPTTLKGILLATLFVVSASAYGGAACLLFPLSCLAPSKKYGEEQDALVLSISGRKTEHYERSSASGLVVRGASSLNDSLELYFWFKVGQTLYYGEHVYSNVFSAGLAYKPKAQEWIGKTLKMRFVDTKQLGIPGVRALFKRPGDGKEYEVDIIQITGPDGKDECKWGARCPPQAKVNRAAREAEQLEALKKSGGKSATDVEPAYEELQDSPPVETNGKADGSGSTQATQESPPAPVEPK